MSDADDRFVPCVPGITLEPGDVLYTFSRSSGPGGQNVNKLSTRVVLTVSWESLERAMPAAALQRLQHQAKSHSTRSGLRIVDQSTRSQVSNRLHAAARLQDLLSAAMVRPKIRRPTRPSAGARRRRIEHKVQRGQLKRNRQTPSRDD